MDIPSIPDNFYKILVTVGIAIAVYAYHDFKQTNDLFDKNVTIINGDIHAIAKQQNETATMLERLKQASELLALRNNINNPLHVTDSLVTFDRLLRGGKKAEQLNDSLWSLYTEYKKAHQALVYQESQLVERKSALSHQLEMLNEAEEEQYDTTALGIFLVIVGLLGLFVQQIYSNELIKAKLREKGKYYRFCQSCGRKFSLMRAKGTDKTGNPVKGFCNTCYQNGEFVSPDMTQERVLNEAIATLKKSSFVQRLWLKHRIEQLERWRKNEYFD